MNDPNPKLVLKPYRLKYSAFVLLLLGTGLLGILMVRDGRVIGWFHIGVAAVFAPFFCWAMTSPRMHLRLNPSGFAFGTLRKRYAYAWSEIASFQVVEFARRRWVCFTFEPCYQGEARVRAINQKFGGFDRFLPDTYGFSAEELAGVLESWRSRFSGAQFRFRAPGLPPFRSTAVK